MGKRALLVGINHYPRNPLRGCVNDVGAVRDFLAAERGFAPTDIVTLCDAEATRAAIAHELRLLIEQSRHGDHLVFYFCGHGAQLASKDPRELDKLDEALCPFDFDWTPATAIVDDELEQLFESVQLGVYITWVFDACHTGEIDEQLDHRVAAYRGLPPAPKKAPTRSGRAGSSVASGSSPSLSPSLQHLSKRGVILTACASTERAADIVVDGKAHGAFTHYLLTAARQMPDATTGEILAQVRSSLLPIGQHPEGYGPGLKGPFICARESPKPSEPTRTVQIGTNPSIDADRHLHMYLAEASRLAKSDDEFSSRITQLGLDLSGISASDASALSRAVKPAPRSGGMVCRSFWWGFHLEIPHMDLEELIAGGVGDEVLERMLGRVPHRVLPHVKTLIAFVVQSFETIRGIDRGAGVFISMSSFAPDLFVTTAVPVRTAPRRDSGDIIVPRA
jgi:metacaspase-1